MRSLASVNRGFTLLEVMVAMLITSMIMTITYSSLKQILRGDELMTAREEQIQQWMHLQTLLQRDAGFLKGGSAAAFQLFNEGFKAQYDGSVVPNMRLGPQVGIEYSWDKQASSNEDEGDQISWQRNLYSPYDETPVLPLQIVLDQGLERVQYELMVENNWIQPDAFVQGSIRALRWTFQWSLIGEWQLVIPVS